MMGAFAAVTVRWVPTVWLAPASSAQAACVTQNLAIPVGANTSIKMAPFHIDTTGLDSKTAPPTRYPLSENCPRATELPDGIRPPTGAEGDFIIGPSLAPDPEALAKDGGPRGAITSFTISSKDSVIDGPRLIRDDLAECTNRSILMATIAPEDKSNMIVTNSHPRPGRLRSTSMFRPNTGAAPKCHSA